MKSGDFLSTFCSMKFRHLSVLLLVGAVPLFGCKKSATAQPKPAASEISTNGYLLHAQSKLPTIQVWLGDQQLTAEIASTSVEIYTGMMFRTNILENEAMLFVFPDAEKRSFYMRNCVIPLSGAYITPGGAIDQIIQMKPHDETGILSDSDDIQFVLEVKQGWFARHHIGVGTVVRTERGSLLYTFFHR